jgi:hypothetical protein
MIDRKTNVARFVYHGVPRVVRVISIEAGNVTGYETRKGKRIVNKRFAPVKAYKFTRMKNGTFALKAR